MLREDWAVLLALLVLLAVVFFLMCGMLPDEVRRKLATRWGMVK